MDIYRDTSSISFKENHGFNYSIIRKGEVYLFGDITEEIAGEFVRKLNENRPEELTVYASTNGGLVSAGLAIHDALLDVPKTVVIASGMCASTGTLILLAGKSRWATPNTHFIVHDVDFAPPTTEEKNQEEISVHLQYLNTVIDELFSKKIKGYLKDKELGVFGIEQAKEFGFINGVIE